MALIDLDFYSETLGMHSSVTVIIPQRGSRGQIGADQKAGDDEYRVLYLLHGLSDDNTIWLRRTSVERYSEKYGICVVMPNCHRSFYTDMKYGGAYYTFLTRELPMRMKEFFKISDRREDTFIAGLSMGGYGALKAAMREPQQYAAGAGLSAVVDIKSFYEQWKDAVYAITGGEKVAPEEDLYELADIHKYGEIKPRLYIGCGRQDMLYESNQAFLPKLKECGYDLTYRESDGNHNWAFWDEYIQYVLEWMFGGKK